MSPRREGEGKGFVSVRLSAMDETFALYAEQSLGLDLKFSHRKR